jgi:hypothetical protein
MLFNPILGSYGGYTYMKDLSILIPARNEIFLKNTVEDILKDSPNCSNDKIVTIYNGIDINKFNEWNDFTGVNFFQRDVFEVIKFEPTFKFDVVITFNTLRAESKMWGGERYNNFLNWCNKHTNYIITNNCTNKELDGFELIDTIQIPNFYDTNLFKIK